MELVLPIVQTETDEALVQPLSRVARLERRSTGSVVALEEPCFHVAVGNREHFQVAALEQEAAVIDRHLVTHRWCDLQAQILSEGTPITGDTPLEGLTPQFGRHLFDVDLEVM